MPAMPLFSAVFEVFATLPKGHTTLRNPKNPGTLEKAGCKVLKTIV